jgi:hypothetical protein
MKHLFVLCIFTLLLSCDDGDLQIDTIDFDSVDIEDCGNISVGQSNVLFKINDDEALILVLPSGVLKNEVSETTITSEVPSGSTLTYRLFSDDVDDDYFCDEIPLTTPTVIDEIEAEGGSILVNTTTEDSIIFTHVITLSEITFITSTDQRITDLQINDFGTVTTTVE